MSTRQATFVGMSLAALLLFSVARGGVARGETVFVADTFLNSNWLASELTDTTPGDTFVFTASQQLTGGNLDAYRRLTHRSSSPDSPAVAINSAHVYQLGSFDPGEDGTVESIDFSWEGISIASTAGAVGYGALVVQDGVYYAAPGDQVLNDAGWQAFSFPGLGSSDFVGVVGGVIDNSLHPDFSDAGSPIQFGFYAGNGTFGESFNEGGVDNWAVLVHLVAPVPEPSSLTILAVGLMVCAGRLLTHRRAESLREGSGKGGAR